jgi:hypothetical protein
MAARAGRIIAIDLPERQVDILISVSQLREIEITLCNTYLRNFVGWAKRKHAHRP